MVASWEKRNKSAQLTALVGGESEPNHVIGEWCRAVSGGRLASLVILPYISVVPLGFGLLFLIFSILLPPPNPVAVLLGLLLLVLGVAMIVAPFALVRSQAESEKLRLTPSKIIHLRNGVKVKEVDVSSVKGVIVTETGVAYLGGRAGRARVHVGRVVVLSHDKKPLLDVEIEDPYSFAQAVESLIKIYRG